jgi:hypothetical protein
MMMVSISIQRMIFISDLMLAKILSMLPEVSLVVIIGLKKGWGFDKLGSWPTPK